MQLLIFIILSIFNSYGADCIEINEPISNECFNIVQSRFAKDHPSYSFHFMWEKDQSFAFAVNISRSLIISGGFAKQEGLTLGGLLTVICHEVGHLVHAYNEGEADYFATNICLPNYINNYLNINHPTADARVEKFCQSQDTIETNYCHIVTSMFSNAAESIRTHCLKKLKKTDPEDVYKNSLAKKRTKKNTKSCLLTSLDYPNLENLSADEVILESIIKLSHKLSFTEKDHRVVAHNYPFHNSPQCRMDTYIAGALNLPKPLCWFSH